MNMPIKLTSLSLALGLALPLASLAAPKDDRIRVSSTTVTVNSLEEDVKAEAHFGRELAAHILGRTGSLDNETLTRYVNLVGKAVAMHGHRPELEYRFGVLDTDAVNAYAAPGGYIFVTRGALALMKDEAELAAVLAHEIAHVTQKHIVKELNIHGTEQSPEAGLVRLLGSAGDPTRVALSQAVEKAVEILFVSGLKQEDEFEADNIGTLLLTSTGYDPTALNRYLERVKAVTGDKTAVLHQTHPPFAARISALKKLYWEEQLMARDGPTVKARFIQYVNLR